MYTLPGRQRYLRDDHSFGLINYPVCMGCMEKYNSDVEMNVAVIGKAIRDSGKPLPIHAEDVPGILLEAGLYPQEKGVQDDTQSE